MKILPFRFKNFKDKTLITNELGEYGIFNSSILNNLFENSLSKVETTRLKELKIIQQNNFVCPDCNHHHYISPTQRFNMMFGENNWKKINSPLVKDPDPYRWQDTKKYTDRLKEAKKITGQDNAILSCEAKINDIDVVVSCLLYTSPSPRDGT